MSFSSAQYHSFIQVSHYQLQWMMVSFHARFLSKLFQSFANLVLFVEEKTLKPLYTFLFRNPIAQQMFCRWKF